MRNKSDLRPGGPFGREWLARRLTELLPDYPDVRVCVALSGGLDSTVLLAALSARRPKRLQLRAVHVDHGLQPNSSAWSEHCRALAERCGVPIVLLKARVVRARGASPEAAARQARYSLLRQTLTEGECLLTGHHADDQLETVLLQLFRGAGLAGLAAMPERMSFGPGWLVRPLLSRARPELAQWARRARLTWVEDDSNANEQFDRNYLRRRVLPLIKERWRGVAATVSRSARHAAEAQRLLDDIAARDVGRAACGGDLSAKTLRALPLDRRRNALRHWIVASGFTVPDTRRLDELAGPLIDARLDANPLVRWGDAAIQREADLLAIRDADANPVRSARVESGAVASAAAAAPKAREARYPGPVLATWAWREQPALDLPESRGRLELETDPHGPLDLDALPETLLVRLRQGGERLRPRRGGQRRALKSLLQESHLPLAQRAALPLLFAGPTLVAAGALWLDESIQAVADTVHRGRLRWQASNE